VEIWAKGGKADRKSKDLLGTQAPTAPSVRDIPRSDGTFTVIEGRSCAWPGNELVPNWYLIV